MTLKAKCFPSIRTYARCGFSGTIKRAGLHCLSFSLNGGGAAKQCARRLPTLQPPVLQFPLHPLLNICLHFCVLHPSRSGLNSILWIPLHWLLDEQVELLSGSNRCSLEACAPLLAASGPAFVEALLCLYRGRGLHQDALALATEDRFVCVCLRGAAERRTMLPDARHMCSLLMVDIRRRS